MPRFDFTHAVDRCLRRFKRRYLRERELPLALAPHYLRKLFDLVQPNLVFDVGANEGQFGTMLRRDVGYRGRLCSIEPIPSAADVVRAAARGDSGWSVHTLALGASPHRAQFNVTAGSEFSSLRQPSGGFADLFGGQNQVATSIDVDVVTLDALAERIKVQMSNARVFLKIDTQGTELDVLAGAGNTMSRIDALQTELSLHPIYVGAPPYTEVLAALDELGFALCALFPNNAGHFPRLLELDALFIRRSISDALA
jgi:FkbM family methyltransferase